MLVVYHYKVREYFESLQRLTKVKLAHSIFLLGKYGQNLGMPHVKFVGGGIFELRIRGQQEVRVFFVFHQGNIHLLHGFNKKSQRTPEKELNIARKRKLELT